MAKQLNKPTPPKRKRPNRSRFYWLLFTVCTIASFAGGFWFTYRGTQVSIKEPPIGPAPSTVPVADNTTATAPGVDPASGSNPTPLVTPAPVDPFAVSDATASLAGKSTKQPAADDNTNVPADNNTAPDATAPTAPPDDQAPAQDDGAGKVYRVQVGNYDSQTAAQSMVDELSAAGIHAAVVEDSSGQYHAQIGAYSKRDRALSVADEVNAKGYSVTIRQ